MLTALRIADFAILHQAELALGPGLTAVTGETGAGKSILLDALAAVLGGRSSDKFIRQGCEVSEIEALFEGVADRQVRVLLDEAGIALDEGEALLFRRVIGRTAGKNRCYLNGRMVPAQVLRQVAALLVDLSAQHAQHRLLDPASHLQLLDRFADTAVLLADYEAQWQRWRTTVAELTTVQQRQAAAADRLDWLKFVHKELSELQPKPGELAEITATVQRLRSSEAIARALQETSSALGGDGSVRELASRTARALEKLANLDPALADFATRLREIEALAGDLDFDVTGHSRTLRSDERALGRMAERQDQLLRAIKKHGGTEEAMLQRLAQATAELDTDTTELRVHELQRDEVQQHKALAALAEQLSEKRHLAAAPLAERIAEVVRQLGMPAASLRMVLTRRTGPLGQTGIDNAVLHLRANRGESEGPLDQVASGGELSRVLLAVQRAMSEPGQGTSGAMPTAIYDEADAGLSGTTGLVLGRFLSEVAQRQQVICISHLPQVAAAADTHVQVSKRETDGRTHSALAVLDEQGRVDELARMLGVVEGQGDTAVAHARRLLGEQRR